MTRFSSSNTCRMVSSRSPLSSAFISARMRCWSAGPKDTGTGYDVVGVVGREGVVGQLDVDLVFDFFSHSDDVFKGLSCDRNVGAGVARPGV